MITDVATLREVRRSFAVHEELGSCAAEFVQSALEDWCLAELVVPMDYALAEMVRWMSDHGTAPHVRCSLTWDESLLFVELRDKGGLVPEPHISRVDAELATRLLAPPAIEWGAELDSRGRQLWVAFAVASSRFASVPPDPRECAL